MPQQKCLPDFGIMVTGKAKSRTIHLIGNLALQVINRFPDGTISLTGGLATNGTNYCATFDFPPGRWHPFGERLDKACAFDPLERFEDKTAATMAIEPPIAVWIDLYTTPAKLTKSTVTNEEFVPLIPQEVREVKIGTSDEALLKRKAWWEDWSGSMLTSLGKPALEVRKHTKAVTKHELPLTTHAFERNMVACLGLSCGHFVDVGAQMLSKFCERGIVDHRGVEILNKLGHLKSHEKLLTNAVFGHLVWFAAALVRTGIGARAVSAELQALSGLSGADSVRHFLYEGIYSLVRPCKPSLPDDNVERAIAAAYTDDSGFLKVLKLRLGKQPNSWALHPEIQHVAEMYLRYDLIRQAHRSGGQFKNLPQEILNRCEDNVKLVVEWVKALSAVEAELFNAAIRPKTEL